MPPFLNELGSLLRSGHDHVAEGDDVQARRFFEQALRLLLGAGLPALEVQARAELVRLDIHGGRVHDANFHVQQCALLARSSAEADTQARALLAEARVAVNLCDTDEALSKLQAALPYVESLGDPILGFECRNMMGIVLSELNQPEAALRWYAAAREDAQRAGRRRSASMALANAAGARLGMGDLASAAGQVEEARAAWQRAVQECDEAAGLAVAAGSRKAQFAAVGNRAAALGQLGQVDAAIAGFRQAAALGDGLGELTGTLQMAALLAQLLVANGDAVAARAEAVAAIAHAEALGTRKSLETLHEIVSSIDETRGDFESALTHHKHLFEVHKAVARDRAAQRAQAMAVRLETAQALADAARERTRADSLEADNAALVEQAVALSEEAMQDALTGLANRRRLDSWLALRHAEAVSRDVPLCVALLDLDHFKHINDGFSHAVGDLVLKQVAAILRDASRGEDLAARYGGEEFVLIFDGVGPARAAEICERVRKEIEDHDWPGMVPGLAVTASFGVCDIARHLQPVQGLARADELLYQAKAAGRNRVCSEI